MRNLILPLGIIALVAVIIILAAQRQPPETNTKPRVAATIFPLADIARYIAGDAVQVVQILPAGANPHTFEPTPSTIAALASSAQIFMIGYGIDSWVEPLAESNDIPLDVVRGDIALRASQEDAEEGNNNDHGDSEGVDPHYWLTIPNAARIAEQIATRLSFLFPEHETTFTSNLAAYRADLADADAQIRDTLSRMQNRNIVTMHDAWYYFAEEYGLTIAGTFEPSAGREPTPQWLAELTEAIERADVHTLYLEVSQSSVGVESFADDNNLTLRALDPEGIDSQTSYIDLMLQNAQLIAQNR